MTYTGFCLGVVGSRAAREGAYTAFPELLYRAFPKWFSQTVWRVLPFLAYGFESSLARPPPGSEA